MNFGIHEVEHPRIGHFVHDNTSPFTRTHISPILFHQFPPRYRCSNHSRMRLSYVFVAVFAVLAALLRASFMRISHKELDWDGMVIPMARAAFWRGEGDEGASSNRPPLEGVKIVITGATNGIGLSLARALTQRLGATVIAVGRSEVKLQKLKGELGDTVTTVQADLVDLSSVSRAADKISETFDSIDILINNAGITYPSTFTLNTTRFATEHGYDRLFVTNYLSHVLLTEKLLPNLQKSPRPTVMQVTSTFHWGVDGSDLVPLKDGGRPVVAARPGGSHGLLYYRAQRAYANSKLGQLYHARSLKRRHPNLRVVSVCPSWVGTDIAGPEGDPSHDVIMKMGYRVDGWGISSALYGLFANEKTGDDYYTNTGFFSFMTSLFSQMPAWTYTIGVRDAITVTYALAGLVGQHFFSEISPTRSSPESYDTQKAEALWDWSYKALSPYL
jgi:NAD(P)-dependent dehydrogenase (short-subunit alcohol dehydrogenase family)